MKHRWPEPSRLALRVHCYAPAAWQWLRHTHQPRLLQLSRQVCNLVNERHEVLALTTPAIGPGPFAIVAEGEWGEVSAESPLTLHPDQPGLTLGNVHINLAHAPRWDARPAWANLHHNDSAAWPPSTWTLPGAHRAQDNLVQGLTAGDGTTCLSAAVALAGRGPGLTPAGDDYLIGALYALWVWQPTSPLITAIAQAAIPHTTTLSAAFLSAAARGEATWHWHYLAQGAPSAPALIVRIGSSSGQAMWRGFMDIAQAGTLAPANMAATVTQIESQSDGQDGCASDSLMRSVPAPGFFSRPVPLPPGMVWTWLVGFGRL